MKQRFEAADGKLFDNEIECLLYEKIINAKPGDDLAKLSLSLFDGCISRMNTNDGYDSEVFYLSDLSKFTYNLIKKLPVLTAHFALISAEVEREGLNFDRDAFEIKLQRDFD